MFLKKLLIYIKDFRRECILAPLFKLLEASFELIVPLIMAAIIDKGIPGGDTRRSAQLRYRAILCGKSGNRLFRQAAPCADGAYPDAELYGA